MISFFGEDLTNVTLEKIGRTKKERKSPKGRKTISGTIRKPLQLSLDVRTIKALNAMEVNKSALFEELLHKYEPFVQAYKKLYPDELN